MSRSSSWSSLAVLGAAKRCAIVVRHGGRCAWCYTIVGPESVTTDDGIEIRACEIDHVLERCNGGRDDVDNLVPACPRCNLDRPFGVRIPDSILREPLDLYAGLQLALIWYPDWLPRRLRDSADRKRKNRSEDREYRDAERASIVEPAEFDHITFGDEQ